jgi:VanZ family protein
MTDRIPFAALGLHRIFKALAISGWAVIVMLSLLPGSERPHTGAGGGSEHFAAYFIVAGCGAIGWPALQGRLQFGTALTVTAALMEFAQIFIPGRNAEVFGAFSSAAGTWSALALAIAVSRLRARGVGTR